MKLMNYARMALITGSAVAMIAMPAIAHGEVLGIEELGIGAAEETGLGTTDLPTMVAKIIRVALSLLGIVAVVIILVGGFKWMTAGGNDENVKKAKQWITNGVIGLAIVLAAFAITKFVLDTLIGAMADVE